MKFLFRMNSVLVSFYLRKLFRFDCKFFIPILVVSSPRDDVGMGFLLFELNGEETSEPLPSFSLLQVQGR